MTKLNNFAVLSAALSILSLSCLVPCVWAAETTTTTATTEKAAPTKTKTAKKRNAKKRAKLKSDASKIIEKGVDKAGTNLTK